MEARELRGEGGRSLADLLGAQARELSRLRAALEGAGGGGGATEAGRRGKERELGYRFDAYPKWLEASGWKDQSQKHRRTWPLLRRFLELERWPGAPVRFTLGQIADHLCCSQDTVRRKLKDLEEFGVFSRESGSGRQTSAVRIEHPIRTPLAYSDVPWAAGGLDGAPDGYLENLRGPKRQYALLYGAQLSTEAGDNSEGCGAADPAKPAITPPESLTDALLSVEHEGRGEARGLDLHAQPASPGVAGCSGLERTEKNPETNSVFPPDAQQKKEEEEKDKRHQARLIEGQARKVPTEEISEGAIKDARQLLEALGRYERPFATRAAQLAQLLDNMAMRKALHIALRRIRRSGRKAAIIHPVRYVVAAVLDVQDEIGLGRSERELGERVIGAADENALARSASKVGKDAPGKFRSITEGYEWLFDAPVGDEQGLRKGVEQRDSQEGESANVPSFSTSSAEESGSAGFREPEHTTSEARAGRAWRSLVEEFVERSNGGIEQAWFGPYSGYRCDDGLLVVCARDEACADEIIERFGEEFRSLWRARAGEDARIVVGSSDRCRDICCLYGEIEDGGTSNRKENLQRKERR